MMVTNVCKVNEVELAICVYEWKPLYIIMAAKRIYSPLLLEDVENIDILLRDIELWQRLTELSLKQQGSAIYLSLPFKIYQECIDISVQILSSDNGLSILLEKTKELYAKYKHSLVYKAYDTFETFHLPSDMNIIDHINEFEGCKFK